jgi:hypothetical protein
MNTINVTVELGPESQAKLDKILQALEGLHPNCQSCTETALRVMGENLKVVEAAPAEEPTAPQEAPKSEPVKSDHPADVVPPHSEPQDVAPAEEPKPTITLDQIRQKVTYLRASSDKKKKDGAKDIVLAYAPNITGLANCEDKWPEIWDKLTALEG